MSEAQPIINTTQVNLVPPIFTPSPFGSALGAAGAFFFTQPSIPGLWGLAAVAATGLVTGYGCRWGRRIGFFVGGLAGGLFGALAGGAFGAAVPVDDPLSALVVSALGKEKKPGQKPDPEALAMRKRIQTMVRQERTTNAASLAAAGALGGTTLFAIGGMLVGWVAGGALAYNVAKADIDQWARGHVQKGHIASVQASPTRSGIKSTAYLPVPPKN